MNLLKSIICCTLFANTAIAQEQKGTTIPVAEKRNEVGIFSHGRINGSFIGNTNANMIGISLTHWKNEHFGYRIINAYGNLYSESGIFQKYTSLDTFVDMNSRTRIDMGIVGGALQAQRKFYKRVYLFAAIELNAGYGTGTRDTLITKTYRTSKEGYSTTSSNGNVQSAATLWQANISPTFGAKLVFNRIVAGVEVYGLGVTYQSITANKTSMSTFDFNIGNLGQRIFINYSFK